MRVSEFLSSFTSGTYRFASVKDECLEMLQEIGDSDAFWDEWGDFTMALQCWLSSVTGWDWEMYLPLMTEVKYRKRITRWETIFADHGLAFDPKYLINGGNHEKPEKVAQALELARKDQDG